MSSSNGIHYAVIRTRRHFFGDCAVGLGQIGLASLISDNRLFSAELGRGSNPMAPKAPHFPAKIKSVIYLFMSGGPSQFELFDEKPGLRKLDGQALPISMLEGKRFAFMDATRRNPRLYAPRRKFRQYGQSGKWVSECLPQTARVVDDLGFISTVAVENPNHAPAAAFAHTGSMQFGRPSAGSWITYGIGSESQELPGFVVLLSGPRAAFGAPNIWLNGFLPSAYQGVPFQGGPVPIPDLPSPPGVSRGLQEDTVNAIKALNLKHLARTGDQEIATRIASYEMAYRMQTSGPELTDFSKESPATLQLYGAEPGATSFANNCLLARRLVERGVRFVQVCHSNWDSHGGPGENLMGDFDRLCLETDRPCAALIADLKQRGLLDQTLVIWGGEFGRAPMGEFKDASVGRNHHIEAFTMWFAGGGVKPGQTIGQTDEIGFSPVADRVDIHDVHATILYLFGLDHKRLTFRVQGRDFRLTDVSGHLIQKLLA
jgi:hypothetical protein